MQAKLFNIAVDENTLGFYHFRLEFSRCPRKIYIAVSYLYIFFYVLFAKHELHSLLQKYRFWFRLCLCYLMVMISSFLQVKWCSCIEKRAGTRITFECPLN